MKPRRNLFLGSLFVIALSQLSHAANLTWDADTGTTGAQDGSSPLLSPWTAGGAGWWNGTTNVNWTNGDTAIFGIGSGTAGSYAVTLGGDVTISTGTTSAGTVLNFASPGNYTISAQDSQKTIGIVTGNVTANIVVAKNVTATIGDNVKISRPLDTANRGQISIYGGATAGSTDGGILIIGSGTAGGNAELVNLSGSHLIEIRQGATLEVKKGGTFTSNSSVVLGSSNGTESNHTNNIKISGGTFNVGGTAAANLVIGNNVNAAHTSTSIVTITDGALNINPTAAGAAGLRFGSTVSNASYVTNGTFHLDGGVVTVGRIYEGTATGGATINSTFNFNGGELKVLSGTANAATFMTGLNTAQVRNGAAKINTNGVNTIIGQALIHSTIVGDNAIDGGLEKRGDGTLTLTNANTYTGATNISQGTLIIGVGGSIANSSTIQIASGATLDVSAISSFTVVDGQTLAGIGTVKGNLDVDGTLSIGNSPGTMIFDGNLTLESGSESNFEINGLAPGNYDLAVAAAVGSQTVTFNGGILNLIFAEGFSSTGSVKIFDFDTYAGTNFTTVSTSGLATGYTASFNSTTGMVTVIPEPRAALLGGLGLLMLLRRRRSL